MTNQGVQTSQEGRDASFASVEANLESLGLVAEAKSPVATRSKHGTSFASSLGSQEKTSGSSDELLLSPSLGSNGNNKSQLGKSFKWLTGSLSLSKQNSTHRRTGSSETPVLSPYLGSTSSSQASVASSSPMTPSSSIYSTSQNNSPIFNKYSKSSPLVRSQADDQDLFAASSPRGLLSPEQNSLRKSRSFNPTYSPGLEYSPGRTAHPYAAPTHMAQSIIRDAEPVDEDNCPVCLEPLALRLRGEKPHVVPICGHKLRKFTTYVLYPVESDK